MRQFFIALNVVMTFFVIAVTGLSSVQAQTKLGPDQLQETLYKNGYLDLPSTLRIQSDVDEQVIRYFMDFSCIYCKSIKDVMANWAITIPDEYTFVYHHVGTDQLMYYFKASSLTYVMNSDLTYQKKVRYIEHMFANMHKVQSEDMLVRLIKESVADVGLAWKDVATYMRSDPSYAQYEHNIGLQQQIGISGTPSILIGGRFLTHLGLTDGKPENWISLLNAVTSAHFYLQHDSSVTAGEQ